MLNYVFRRLFTAIPTLFVIVTLAFFLIRIAPGGPFNQERGLSPEIRANLEAQFGLGDPLWRQYLNYLNNLVHGNFGPSYNLPDFTVGELFAAGLPISVQLGASALILDAHFTPDEIAAHPGWGQAGLASSVPRGRRGVGAKCAA